MDLLVYILHLHGALILSCLDDDTDMRYTVYGIWYERGTNILKRDLERHKTPVGS